MEELLKSIDSKMNIIIKFLLESKSEEKESDGKIADSLSGAGINNADIAKILGKTTKQVSDLIYVYNKRKK